MKKSSLLLTLGTMVLSGAYASAAPASSEDMELAAENIKRASKIMDITWSRASIGKDGDFGLKDQIHFKTSIDFGPSDVWPYTAAIEAHNSMLEALEAIKKWNPTVYDTYYSKYRSRLDQLIDNLEWYRGTYSLASYATEAKDVSPYAVPRAGQRGGANVTGILNVYDDQEWLARELIRAYRVTDNEDYLDLATYLVDYVLEGWDCWRDNEGNEYGGITWGPGYNSKHACSNAPMVQPLVWLHDIYKGTEETMEYAYRNENNEVVTEIVEREDHYLMFAKKIYDWQKDHLYDKGKKVFYDMLGADNTIIVEGGYRQHMDTGNATGAFISYNTGTMISGAAELCRVTGEHSYADDINDFIDGSWREFATYVRRPVATYVLKTDASYENGFNTWFNDVLLRSYVDAIPYAGTDGKKPLQYIGYHQTNLDYAFENNNVNNLLPINLLDGWGDEVRTKPFHQFSFAAEYALFAKQLIGDGLTGIEEVASAPAVADNLVYNLHGVCLGEYNEVKETLPAGIYVVNSAKVVIK